MGNLAKECRTFVGRVVENAVLTTFGRYSDGIQEKRIGFVTTAQSPQEEVTRFVTDTEISKPYRTRKYVVVLTV